MNQQRKADQARRGEAAERILNDEVFTEAFNKIEESLIEQFKDSKIADDDGRRHAREALGILAAVKGEFERLMHTGKQAKKEIAQAREESKLRSMFHGR